MRKNVSDFFFEFFEVSGESHSAEICEREIFGVSRSSILLQRGKNEGRTLWKHLKKLRKKVSQSRNNMNLKNWSRVRLEPTSFSLAEFKKP